MFTKLKNFVLTGKEKAWVAFLVSTVTSYMAQNGLTTKDLLDRHAVYALLCGVAAHVFVYMTSNSQTPPTAAPGA